MNPSKGIRHFGAFHIAAVVLGCTLLIGGESLEFIHSVDGEALILYFMLSSYSIYLACSGVAALDRAPTTFSFGLALLPVSLAISYSTITIAPPRLLLPTFEPVTFLLDWLWNLLFLIGTGWILALIRPRFVRVLVAVILPLVAWALELIPVVTRR